MSDHDHDIDWRKTTFDGSRREQLRQAQAMTVRQRLEALDQLTKLSERMQAMPRQTGHAKVATGVREPSSRYRNENAMNEITLPGCTPTPLASYLKALGVLRLLSVTYPQIRAAWHGERLVLNTTLDAGDLEAFFLHEYQPTPIMAPWNGGSGFYFQERKSKEKDPVTGKKRKWGIRDQPTSATKAVDAVIKSSNVRFGPYRNALESCKRLVDEFGLDKAPANGTPKDRFVLMLRAILPDDCLEWIDAALAIAAGKTRFPPLLGTGGNDGNLDFTTNFMQRLTEVIGLDGDHAPPKASSTWLGMALFGEPAPGLVKNAIGQFSPGQAGGPNATAGFGGTSMEADARINPWDYVLAIEGTLLFAAAAVRRNADDRFSVLSYPFTVRAVGAGSGSLGESDAKAARGELWMPLWNRPATYAEIRALLAEGRVALGKKPARDALDFVRAIHHLGGYRGIESFQRYGLLMRSGKAYLATPLERVEVATTPHTSWLDELDHHDWLNRFRRFAQGENVSNRFLSLRRRLEDALFDLSGRKPTATESQALIILLSEIQSSVSVSHKAQESVPPIPILSERWVEAANDHSSAFRIARALAGLTGTEDTLLPLRAQLFPVHPHWNVWMTPDYIGKHAAKDPACRVRTQTQRKSRLPETLQALLSRRLWLAEKLDMRSKKTGLRVKPIDSPAGVTLDDITAFLNDDVMDARIAELLPGLSLCAIPRDVDHGAGDGAVPAAFALLKLCLTPDAILRKQGHLGEQDFLPVPASLLVQLAAGNAENRAVKLAWRRLRASGLASPFHPGALPQLGHIAPSRAAAALLIPLRFGATAALARSVLEKPEPETV